MSDLEKIEEVFAEALNLYKKRNAFYGSAWKEGRPIGITDNLLWIAKRIQIMERRLIDLQYELKGCIDVREQIEYCEKKITDDILDLINFAAFRYIMHEERKELI